MSTPLSTDSLSEQTAATAETTAETPPAEKQTTSMPALKKMLAPVKTKMIIGLVMSFIGGGLLLVPAVAIAEIALHRNDLSTNFVLGWLIATAICLVAGNLLINGVTGWSHKIEADYRGAMRTRIAKKLSVIPLGWFADTNSGNIKKTLKEDVANIHSLVAHGPAELGHALAGPIVGFGILFYYDWRFALGMLLWFGAAMAIFSAIRPKNLEESTEMFMSAQGRISQALVELVDGITVVKNFSGTGKIFERFNAAQENFIEKMREWMTKGGRSQSLGLAILNPAGMLPAIIFFSWVVIHFFDADPALIAPFLTISIALPGGVLSLVPLIHLISAGMESAQRLQDVLDLDPLPLAEHPTALPDSRGLDVRFEDVSFSYDGTHQVINHLSAAFPAGTTTALVGPSGSGKTTLTRLISRSYDVTGGAIYVGGVDIRQANDEELLAHLAIVDQDVSLINDTIRENIALGHPEASAADIELAAKRARIHDRIMRLPHGYDTVVGGLSGDENAADEGAYLSGGEQQRVSLARAFLRDAPVLLLDEATAWADPHSEREIQEAIAELAKGRTVIVVAHRLATVVGADNILVLDSGKVVESGTHDELLAKGDMYATLWEAQQ